jgi:hypothetical protein
MRVSKTVLFILLISTPAVVSPQASGVPVDPSVAVTPPSADVPKELAAFSGKWGGPFNGVNSGAYMSDAYLVVEAISSATDVRVYYAQIGRFTTNYGEKRAYRATAAVANGTLQFTMPDNLTVACSVRTSDTLNCTITNAQGGQNRGTFRRIQG